MFLGIVCLVLFARAIPFADLGSIRPPQDFTVYLKARAQASSGINPYDLSAYLAYKYSPGVILLFDLLPSSAAWAWIVFKLMLVLTWGVALGSAMVRDAKLDATRAALFALGLVLSWKGLLECLDFGQIDILYLALAVLAAQLPAEAAGAILGSFFWIKPPWCFLLLPFGLRAWSQGTSRRLAAGFVGAGAFWGALAPVVAWGPTRTWEWTASWIEMLRSQKGDILRNGFNQSLWSIALRPLSWPEDAGWLLLWGVLIVLLTGGCALFLLALNRESSKEQPVNPIQWISPWLLLSQLLSPLGWRWGSLYATGIPLSWALRSSKRTGLRWANFAFIAALFILQLNPVAKALGFGHWTDLHPYGTITLYWAALLASVIATRWDETGTLLQRQKTAVSAAR